MEIKTLGVAPGEIGDCTLRYASSKYIGEHREALLQLKWVYLLYLWSLFGRNIANRAVF